MESLATLDAKFMNSFFASKKLSIDDFRIPEANESDSKMNPMNSMNAVNSMNSMNHLTESNELTKSNAHSEPTKPDQSSQSVESHRYASFIQSRIDAGVRMVDASEALLADSSVQQLWTRFHLHELVAPIEDVLLSKLSRDSQGWEAALRLACLLRAFSNVFLCGQTEVTQKKRISLQPAVLSPLIKHFIRESLKLRNCMINDVCWIDHRFHELVSTFEKCENPEFVPEDWEIVELGSLLLASKQLWPLMLHMVATEKILKGEEHDRVMRCYTRFLEIAKERELMEMWNVPSILNVERGGE